MSALFSLPILILYEEKVIQSIIVLLEGLSFVNFNIFIKIDQTQCWIDLGSPGNWQIYMSLVATVLFVIPAIIIAACYAIIVRTIWSKGSLLMSSGRW